MTDCSDELTLQAGRHRITVAVRHQEHSERVTLAFLIDTDADCRLHWGLGRVGGGWRCPPKACWPAHTEPFDRHAVQSPFAPNLTGESTLEIPLELSPAWHNLLFVLYFPQTKRWVKDGRKDFCIPLPRSARVPSAKDVLAARVSTGAWQRKDFDLGYGESLATAVSDGEERVRVLLACDLEGPLTLHWGLAERFRHEWRLPPPQMRPAGSEVFDTRAVHTPFAEKDGVRWLEMAFTKPTGDAPMRGMDFVLYQPQGRRWVKAGGKDMHLPLLEKTYDDAPLETTAQKRVADEIVSSELGRGSWTLMHRFKLCHDLLEGAEEDQEVLALLFTWLRYSAIRQLDWQRRYNTKPSELADAQNRLTNRLARLYCDHPKSRTWVRLMLGTLGRGGGRGQQVRDEILNIMHRHHIKEVGGHFMEEWHQKLHNNTTPDDIVICEAYLAFLASDGDLSEFYRVLSAGGVSRERLLGFERPIRTDPDFIADKKDGLTHDFRNYLRVLKSVHSATDLESAVSAVRGVVDEGFKRKLDSLFTKPPAPLPEAVRPRDRYKKRAGRPTKDGSGNPVVTESKSRSLFDQGHIITEVRRELVDRIAGSIDDGVLRELLYLDMALEEALRVLVQRQPLGRVADEDLFALTGLVADNLCLSVQTEEFEFCATHLRALMKRHQNDTDWALQAKAVSDRLGRAVSDWTSTLYATVQPKAEFLGEAFAAAEWIIRSFGEEVIRGGSVFPLSRLLRRVDPVLRRCAGIGGWQVISPARVFGEVHVVDSLMSVQGESYGQATVLVTDRVLGEEEIPEGVTAVITPDTPDLVSHVAVRARNAPVLFATCFDEDTLHDLKSREGLHLVLDVGLGGEVEYAEGEAETLAPGSQPRLDSPAIRRRAFSHWAVASEAFDEEIVGGKSNNLMSLRGNVSDWVRFPLSLALPFGVFEETLASSENQRTAEKLPDLVAEIAVDPSTRLVEVRTALGGLVAPERLRDALLGTWRRVGLPALAWDRIWHAVTRVWASKWNDRAYYSRTARGISHDDLMMAVLVQQVVKSDYSFVIHTVNPMTGNEDEIYAEVVLGMGETLVGNYPGRALGFVCRKQDFAITLVSYPSKSIGLYGHGVIFRSDSNGEDLDEFAGAGLYDSFLAEQAEKRLLDYTEERLLHDRRFGNDVLSRIARIGVEVEQTCGRPQDIEGAVQEGEFYVVQTRPQVGLASDATSASPAVTAY
jgi:alpha-glucan,water dikinase